MVNFKLDAAGKTDKIDRYWEYCVGSCHATTALREDFRRQLAVCARELGFKYLRFHGLFMDDMSVARKGHDGKGYVLSFTNVDLIFDFLLSIGMKPFIELGFMPECFASGDRTVFHYKGNITPPASPETWRWFITEFTRHLVDRYGRDEVRQWFFEVWNEPNLGGPDKSCGGFWAGSIDDYFALYKVTAEAVKSVDPYFKTGGPATSNNALIPETIAYCKKHNVPLDFISTHHYPTDVILGYGVEDSSNFWQGDDDKGSGDNEHAIFQLRLWKRVDRGVVTGMTKRAVREAGELPVYYTEWNSLAGLPSDGPFGASFIAKTVMDNMNLVKAYSYWTFTDIFEEGGMPSAAFHGGFGLMTLQGVRKASYNAFKLLHTLGDEMYAARASGGTVDAYAFKKAESGCVQILAVNHHSLFHDIKAESVKISLDNIVGTFKAAAARGAKKPAAVLPKTLNAEIYRIDGANGNAVAEWEALGRPEYVTEGQIHRLHAASEMRRETLTLPVTNGAAELKIDLPPQGIALITIYV